MTTTANIITNAEAVSLLAAHTAFEDHGGDRNDEWHAGYDSAALDYPCISLRLSQLRHAENGTTPAKAKYNAERGTYSTSYGLPDGTSPVDVVVEALQYDNVRDYYNAEASDVTERLLELIENA